MDENYQQRSGTNNFSQTNNSGNVRQAYFNPSHVNGRNNPNNKNAGSYFNAGGKKFKNPKNPNNRINNFANNVSNDNQSLPHFLNNSNSNSNSYDYNNGSNAFSLDFGVQKNKNFMSGSPNKNTSTFNKFNTANKPGETNANATGPNGGPVKKNKRNKKKGVKSNNFANNTNNFGNNITNNIQNMNDFVTERLNRSLSKDYTSPNNSFEDRRPSMPTSISLDNFDLASINFKRSPTMPNTLNAYTQENPYSNLNSSPYKNKFLLEEQTIQESLEYEPEEEGSSKTQAAGTTVISNNDDSVSFYSTPLNGTKNNSNAETSEGQSSVSSVSPNGKFSNEQSSNGDSQILVTASEGETSFDLDPAIENTITNVAIEISYGKELETLESCISDEIQHPFSIKQCLEEQLANNKYRKAESNDDILSENISPRTSISESVTDSETIPAVNPLATAYSVDYLSLPVSTATESDYESQEKYISESSNDMIHETDFIASMVKQASENINMFEKKENLTDFYGLSISPKTSLDILTPQSMSIINEIDSNTNETTHNLAKMNSIDEEISLKYSNIEEEEVMNLVNKIVVDVISHSLQADATPTNQEIDDIEHTFTKIQLDHSDSEVIEEIISSANTDNNFEGSKTAFKCEKDDQFVLEMHENPNKLVIESIKFNENFINEEYDVKKDPLINANEEISANLQTETTSIDLVETSSKQVDSIFKLSENKNAGLATSSKTDNKVAKKEPVVDCFSCTIV